MGWAAGPDRLHGGLLDQKRKEEGEEDGAVVFEDILGQTFGRKKRVQSSS